MSDIAPTAEPGWKTPALSATAEDGHHKVKLCEAAPKSSNLRRWVKL